MWAMHILYKLFDCSWTALGCSSKRSTFLSKESPANFSTRGLSFSITTTYINVVRFKLTSQGHFRAVNNYNRGKIRKG